MKQSIRLLVLLLCAMTARLAAAQNIQLDRMIIGTNVVCRDQPDVASAMVGAFGLGDQLVTADSREIAGDTWYLVTFKVATTREFDFSFRPSECWVHGTLTTPFEFSDPEPALIALADHALTSEEATFEDLVAAENVLNADSVAEVVDSSARLQLRRLQVVDLALSRSRNLREPLVQSWIQSHEDLIRYWSIGLNWYIPSEEYWRLYESFVGAPGAEEIAWTAATAAVYFDECYTYCRLNLIQRTRMQYWTRFPAGRYIDEALPFAIDQIELAGRYCLLGTTGYLQMDFSPIRGLVDELRASLDAVSSSGKESTLESLADIERDCLTSQVSDLDDPLAIPGLARALGSGFSIVPRQLAGFGEQALPVILEVMRRPELNSEVARDGLLTLRYMVDLPATSPLSAAALQEVRAVTEQWLAMPEQSILTLGTAIDLAILIDDSALREIVQSLARDPEEVYRRVARDETALRFIQRRATERLAGSPPLPRP